MKDDGDDDFSLFDSNLDLCSEFTLTFYVDASGYAIGGLSGGEAKDEFWKVRHEELGQKGGEEMGWRGDRVGGY